MSNVPDVMKISAMLLCLGCALGGMEPPKYLSTCKRDAKLNECAIIVARMAIAQFALGDASRALPALEPLNVPEIRVLGRPGGNGLSIVFTDNVFTGLSQLHLDYLNFDLQNRKIVTEGMVNIVMKSKYEMSGKILVFPITGNGDSVIKLKNTNLTMRYNYEIIKKEDGMDYWNIVKDDLNYEVEKAIFKLDNLFNGDKVLGDNTNRLLNEMSREVVAEIGPPIAKAIGNAVFNSLNKLLGQVPIDILMPPA